MSGACARSLAVVFLLVLSACTRHVHVPFVESADRTYLPPVPTAAFGYQRPADVRLGPSELELEGYRVHALSYASSGDNGQTGSQVDGLYYQSATPGARQLLIVLPIWGTHTYPPEVITAGYARRTDGGVHIVRILGEQPLFEWERLAAVTDEEEFVRLATLMADRVRLAAIDLRRLLDWVEGRPEIDPTRIGVIGFSMGAIVAAMAMGNEPRLSVGVLMMGAANPGDIFAECVGRAGAVRENAMRRFGWSLERYRAFFTELFRSGNPSRFAGRYNPGKILMIDAAEDDCMPQSSRDALHEALGYPERISFKYPHKKAFLSMTPLGFNFTRRRIYEFLDRTL